MSALVSGIGAAFGLGGRSGGVPGLPATPQSLERLSLSQLTNLGTKTGRRRSELEMRFQASQDRGGVGGQRQSRRIGTLAKREREISTARRSLIRRGTAQRARRATSITTLLTQGR